MRLLSAALVLSASTLALAGTAHATERAAAKFPCGYHVVDGSAFYNHCGSGNVLIHIDKWPFSDEEQCVSPGNTIIGRQTFTPFAYYLRPC
ncbi:DUF6355 family natural product biosynthesis protein [Allokutzneria sp. NRRL B-24872]|uniref:DUF6355 family natural product biosynthesis protein n=1 Tax=Allokutzneria sp. NRRL B-24872 TaxID=1137961 RepID=UPI000A3A3916|nr:DUF6355 family natural product biosynthesis protein [Allokutzneria sp. NRRL B-24872]